MRRAMILAALALCTPAWGATVSAGSFNIRSAQDVLGCADVRAFGAVGDGVHDDTAAIQAAVNSWAVGGPVCFPLGVFKISSTITLRVFTSLLGSGGSSVYNINSSDAATIVDGTGLGDVTAIQGAGNSTGARFKDFIIWGPASGTSNQHGFDPGSGARDFLIENVGVVRFRYGFYLGSAQQGTLLNCNTQVQAWAGQPAAGLLLNGAQAISILGGSYANANGYNVWMTGGTNRVQMLAAHVDEAFSSGSVVPAPIYIDNAQDIVISVPRLYYGHGGYGIRLGNGSSNPTNVTIRDVKIQRWSASTAPLAAIEIRGSGHKLSNVKVDVSADSGTVGISDLATDTRWDAVTVTTTGSTLYTAIKDPNLPTINPGAGAKAIWADPADSYRVKWAN